VHNFLRNELSLRPLITDHSTMADTVSSVVSHISFLSLRVHHCIDGARCLTHALSYPSHITIISCLFHSVHAMSYAILL